ncbi:hypothetical protein BDW59DRAFT_158893 [Aspergillus cavernicola]|uniref:Uncharacterized protein n=1 Tax=Aspergillus cavernicola TaxID=176166 RepID=A0ABR4IPW4_9EURO
MDPPNTNTTATGRPWDINAPQILWAHELRRENIQLVSQMDRINTILSSAMNSIDALHKTIDVLGQQVTEQEEQRAHERGEVERWIADMERALERRIMDIEGAQERRFAALTECDVIGLSRRVKELEDVQERKFTEVVKMIASFEVETEHGLAGLRGKVGELEGDRGVLRKKDVEDLVSWNREANERITGIESAEGMLKGKVDVLEREGEVLKRELGMARNGVAAMKEAEVEREREHQHQETSQSQGQDCGPSHTLSNPTANDLKQGISACTPSQTTWESSLSDLEQANPHSKHPDSNGQQQNEEDEDIMDVETILRTTRQDRRSLMDYLAHVDGLRAKMPSINEARFVGAFMWGLDIIGMRSRIRRRMGCSNNSWEKLVAVVQEMIQSEAAVDWVDEKLQRETTRELSESNEINKKRRCIPIIPFDEEDAIIAASMQGLGGG